jgi:hypothetical protein
MIPDADTGSCLLLMMITSVSYLHDACRYLFAVLRCLVPDAVGFFHLFICDAQILFIYLFYTSIYSIDKMTLLFYLFSCLPDDFIYCPFRDYLYLMMLVQGALFWFTYLPIADAIVRS